MRKYPVKLCFLLFCILVLSGFEVWDHFSPLPAHEWNTINLKEINVADPNNFCFAVFGDNRNSISVFENLLQLVDHDPDICFAINLGDMVYSGAKRRYRCLLQQVRDNLAIPLVTAMGNHELRGKGRILYHDIFGPFYYSFQIGKNYFIVLDDVNQEGLDVQQRRWLEKELKKSRKYDVRIVFMHMPLYDPKGGSHHHCLPKKSSDRLIELFLKYRVTHIFASHIHGYFEGRLKGIPCTITGGAGAELVGDDPDHYFFNFLKVHIEKDSVDVQVKHVLSLDYEWMGRFGYMIWLYTYGFFRIHSIEIALLSLIGGLLLVIYRSES